MLGYPRETWHYSASFLDTLLHPDDREPLQQLFLSASNAQLPVFKREIRLLHRNGDYRWMLLSGQVVKGGNAQVIGTLQDITKRKEAEQLPGGCRSCPCRKRRQKCLSGKYEP